MLYRYRFELVLLTVALATATGSIVLAYREPAVAVAESTTGQDVTSKDGTASPDQHTYPGYVYVEVSGAVRKPGVFKIPVDGRIVDAMAHAGGLADTADASFVSRNINMARFVTDQEKIHIPSLIEIDTGIFVEQPRTLEYLDAGTSSYGVPDDAPGMRLPGPTSLNGATTDELDALPGIGPASAAKIVEHRPYAHVSELLEKKVISASAYEGIKDLVEP
jgi:competence protein ComEA